MLSGDEIRDCLYVFDCSGQKYLRHITSLFCLEYIHICLCAISYNDLVFENHSSDLRVLRFSYFCAFWKKKTNSY